LKEERLQSAPLEMKACKMKRSVAYLADARNAAGYTGSDQIHLDQVQEKKRREKQHCELKHRRQLEDVLAMTDFSVKESVQMQNEKRKMLMEHETMKLKSQDDECQA
jgi:hypothetical protein